MLVISLRWTLVKHPLHTIVRTSGAQVLYYELWIGAYFPYLMCNILTR